MNLSSGFSTMLESNQSVQLQRLARILKLCIEQVKGVYYNIILYKDAAGLHI